MANLLKNIQTFYENSTFLILIEKNMNFMNKDQNQLLDSEYKYRS